MSVFGSGSSGGGFFGSKPKPTSAATTRRTTTRRTTTRRTTTRRTTPYVRPTRPAATTRPRKKGGKGAKGGKGGKTGGKVDCPPGKNIKRCRDLEAQKKKQHDSPSSSIFEQQMAAPIMESPVKDRNLGATGAQFDNFIMDFLSPFLIEEKTTPRTTTTTQPPTTKKTSFGGSLQSFTGIGAPDNPTSGVCRINPKSAIYAAISSRVGSRDDCGRCVFVWCPSFSGCRGAPIAKVQIVDVYDGPGHIALSHSAFKAAIGLPTTKGNKEDTYQGTYSFTSC